MSDQATSSADRPEFMIHLGLLPPYTADDVRMAYRERAKLAHPDHGGTVAQFKELQEAYDRALEYTKFHSGRREWLAGQVDRYIDQQAAIAAVRQVGGSVEIEHIDWLRRSIGDDFATLTDRLRGIRARNLTEGDQFIHRLIKHRPALEFLLRLDLAGSRVSDAGLKSLQGLPLLEQLDLSGSQITGRGVSRALGELPNLRWLNIAGMSINWWQRWRLRRSRPNVKIVS
jgi:Leucine Rich repeat